MIALIHSGSWMPTGRAKFATGSEESLNHSDPNWIVEFEDGQPDYINSVSGYKAVTSR